MSTVENTGDPVRSLRQAGRDDQPVVTVLAGDVDRLDRRSRAYVARAWLVPDTTFESWTLHFQPDGSATCYNTATERCGAWGSSAVDESHAITIARETFKATDVVTGELIRVYKNFELFRLKPGCSDIAIFTQYGDVGDKDQISGFKKCYEFMTDKGIATVWISEDTDREGTTLQRLELPCIDPAEGASTPAEMTVFLDQPAIPTVYGTEDLGQVVRRGLVGGVQAVRDLRG